MVFSYFSGNIKHVRPLGKVDVNQFIKAHKNPTPETLRTLHEIKLVGDDKVKKRSLKGQLYSFTPSVYFDKDSRRYANIKSFTGYAQLDFDGLSSLEEANELKQYIFDTYEMIVCAYLSPSRLGVKALIQIPVIDIEQGVLKAIEEYKDYYRAIAEEFGNYKGFDMSPQNAVLPLFISYDYDILYRETVIVWDIKKKLESHVGDTTGGNFDTSQINNYHVRKVYRITTHSINSISGNGHPQVLKAGLILGSRVGYGYIDKFEAESLISNLIKSNGYLAKGIDGYIKTAMWAIDQGLKNPRSY